MSATQQLLRRLLDQSGGASETGFLLVIDGEGLGEDLPAHLMTPKGPCAVHRVETELGLRHLLWRARGAPLIAILPEALAHKIQASPDLLRRARNQRVQSLSANDVLEVFLGARVVGAEAPHLQALAMEHLERLGLALSQRTLPTVVDRKLLSELLVDVSVGERVRTQPAAELLAHWLKEPPRFSPALTQLICEVLPTLHGEEGRLLSWALAQPESRLRELVVYGAVLTVDAEELPRPAWGPLRTAAVELALDPRVARRAAATLAERAIMVLGDNAVDLLAEADRLARNHLVPAQLQTSRVLPLALLDRCHALAQQAAAGKVISAEAVQWLTTHRAARLHRAEVAVLEALARLTRYLDGEEEAAGDVVAQVRSYQQKGAFADLAMLQLRRAQAGSALYHAEVEAVLRAAQARRDQGNQTFAKTLAQGYEAALHREGLTPLHRLWKRVVAPLWQTGVTPLYVVVLDGCSYPVFLELLHALSQDSGFPVGIRPDKEGRVAGLPALAPLPTITSHARGALFLGEMPGDSLIAETTYREDEGKTDKKRLQQNLVLKGQSSRLFLKGDLTDGGQALLAALRDEALTVVSAVFNAVDDQIGSDNTGAVVHMAPEDIRGFKPSLRAALGAGRRVLLTADHGHSPFIDKSLRRAAGKTPRYLSLQAGETPPEGYLEIDLRGLGGAVAPGERRAFAWRSGVYLGGAQVGFHGGCSLEEMVVPLCWLERDGLYADEPPWWYGRGAVPETPVARPLTPPLVPATPTVPPVAPVVPPQLTLPLAPVSVAGNAAGNAAGSSAAERIGSLGLPAALVETLSTDERAMLVLLKENGSARSSELAAQLGRVTGRFAGQMTQLGRKLHKAGCARFVATELQSGELSYRYVTGEDA